MMSKAVSSMGRTRAHKKPRATGGVGSVSDERNSVHAVDQPPQAVVVEVVELSKIGFMEAMLACGWHVVNFSARAKHL